jgi:transcriptional regulator with XRE-family HTH domain
MFCRSRNTIWEFCCAILEGESVKNLLDRLRETFQDESARYAYAEDFLNCSIAAQIKALREDQELSQEELAEMIGTRQSGISRLENVNYTAWKVETLRKVARALGVRLRISFEEFGSLSSEIEEFRPEKLGRRKFEDDPVFQEPGPTPAPAPVETVPRRGPLVFNSRNKRKVRSGERQASTQRVWTPGKGTADQTKG